MKIITFKVKVITPTLMGGGFGQNDGIRPAEIKGIMQYWFRAVAGSIVGNDIKALKELESLVFGSQERKSPFRIFITEKNLIKGSLNFRSLPNGAKYLGFVLNLNRERLDNVIMPKSQFSLSFLFKPNLKPEIKRLIALSFYLATALGGFGLRARRGFGSWQIINSSVKIGNFNFESYNKNSILEAINISIKEATKLAKYIFPNNNINQNISKIPSYNIIDENFVFKLIKKDVDSWKDLLHEIGAYYRGFRVNSQNPKKDNFRPKATEDYKKALKAIENRERLVELENVAFGLNIQYGGFSVEIQKREENNFTPLRRSSQFFISIKRQNRTFIIILSNFLSGFKPKDNTYSVIVNSRRWKPFVKIDNQKFYNHRNKFINFIERVWGSI